MHPCCGWRGMNLCKKNMCKNFVGSFAIYQIKKSAVGAGGVNSIPTGALELVQKILVTQYYSRSLIILRKSKGLHAVPLSSGSELFRKGKETILSSGYFRAGDDDTILDKYVANEGFLISADNNIILFIAEKNSKKMLKMNLVNDNKLTCTHILFHRAICRYLLC